MSVGRSEALSIGQLEPLLASWRLHLDAANLSPRTIQSYLEAAERFVRFLSDAGMPTTAAGVTREHVEAFLADLLARHSAATAANRYRSLRQLFRWLEEEGEIAESPMRRMRPPRQPEVPVPVFADDELRALLSVCPDRRSRNPPRWGGGERRVHQLGSLST